MIEPIAFGFNPQTAESNSFQNNKSALTSDEIQNKALAEFNGFVSELENVGIDVITFKDTLDPHTPDSIFPNNWISTHHNSELNLYPMEADNRRLERRNDIVNHLRKRFNYHVVDYTEHEKGKKYLEGTGSIVFDHVYKKAFAAISSRTDETILKEVCSRLGYSPITFRSYGKKDEPIYHTNVMLCIGDTFIVVALDTVHEDDKEKLLKELQETKKEIINISNDQAFNSFAGNMLQLKNQKDEKILVLSETAYHDLTQEQVDLLKSHNDILLPIAIPTIEELGGGSVRCVIAEIFWPHFDNL